MKTFFRSLQIIFYCLGIVSLALAEELPKDIKWETNNDDPIYASPKAIPGGTLRTFMLSFPLTLRLVGPDSNGSFAGVKRSLTFSPTEIHPNTKKPIPIMATHWAYGKDQKTLYLKLNQNAKWSDGKPVTADDYEYTLEFMRSKFIVAPWYNNYYTKVIDKVIKFDDYTIAIRGHEKKSPLQMHLNYALKPTPKHFYGKLDKNFIKKFNWKPQVGSGPYVFDEIRKGKYITLKRQKDWWGNDVKYLKHRFNVSKIKYTVIRDINIAYESFKKGKLDAFGLTLPQFWHQKATGKLYDQGFVTKLWFYNDKDRAHMGIWLNRDKKPLDNRDLRLAINHSLNIEKVLTSVLRGDYQRLHTPFYGVGDYTNDEIRARKYDLAKAEEYYKKAGWSEKGSDGIRVKNGKRLSFKITYGVKQHTDRLVVLKEDAKKAGLELVLHQLDPAASFKSMLEKQHELAHSGFGSGMIPAFWEFYHSENAHKPQTNNLSNIDIPELDKLIDQYRKTYVDKDKARISRKIQKIVHDDGAFIPTYMVPYFRQAYWSWWQLPTVPATKMSDSAFDPLDAATGGLFWFDKSKKEAVQTAKKAGKALGANIVINETFKSKL